MTHSVVTGQLAAAVANGGNFTASYASGKNAGSHYLAMGHKLVMAGTVYNFPEDFNVTLGTSNITITNASGVTWPIDSNWRLQMEEQGDRISVRREVRDPNKSAVLPVQHPALVASAVRGAMVFLNMGAPDTADPDGILDGVAAEDSALEYDSDDWESTFDGTLDVPRALSAQGSAGSNHVLTITGKDVYGRDMVETITLSGTTKIWGNKAFKTISTVGVAAGAASDTFDLGWEDRLGLPVFMPSDSNIVGCLQDGLLRPKQEIVGPIQINQTDLLAGTSQYALSLFGGYVTRMSSAVQVAVTTGGDLTLEIETAAVTGLTVTVADAATVGTLDTDVPTTLDGTDSSPLVAARGDLEVVVDSAFATAGALTVHIEVATSGLTVAGLRASGGSTATSADVRGLWVPPAACDGSIVFQLACMLPDPGFIGIDQYSG